MDRLIRWRNQLLVALDLINPYSNIQASASELEAIQAEEHRIALNDPEGKIKGRNAP